MKKKSIIVLSCLLLIALSLPAIKLHHEKAQRTKCMAQLSSIGKALALYSADHSEPYPSDFNKLVPKYIESLELFHCPCDSREIGDSNNINEWCSYIFMPSSSNVQPNQVHAYCPPENHENKSAHILFFDGSVLAMKPNDFNDLMKPRQKAIK